MTAPAGAAAQTVELFGLRVHEKNISATIDFANLGVVFVEIINAKLKLAPHIGSRVAIAQLNATNKTCVLFVDKGRVTKGEIASILELLDRGGFTLPGDGQVQGYTCESQIVLGLSQGHITSEKLSIERDIKLNPEKNALMSSFIGIVNWAFVNQADDLDFVVLAAEPESYVAFMIGGKYVKPQNFRLPTDTILQMLGIAWQLSGGGASSNFQINIEQQARVEVNLPRSEQVPEGARIRLRWSGMANDRGTVVTMRLQRLGASSRIRSLQAAGYLPWYINVINRNLRSEGGMTVYAGVVGSGKSTSLAASMAMLPPTLKKISIEDPVELEIPDMHQKTVARDVTATGIDPAFVSATRAVYRSALHVLLLGEIRDFTTGSLAREVAESGHSVYTTIHAGSALGVINRLASPAVGIPRDVLAVPNLLKLLVYQMLMPVSCPHCRKSPDDFAKAYLSGDQDKLDKHHRYFDLFQRLYNIDPSKIRMRDPHGCPQCRKQGLPELNGYMGRTVVAEMVEPDEHMLPLILSGDSLGLFRYWRGLSDGDYESETMTGKTTMECAILRASRGDIDPHEIEERFMSFETVELKRRAGMLI